VTPARSNSKDDSMTTRNSRNESNNKSANPVGTPAKAETLAKIVKQTIIQLLGDSILL
jgi:hypothetical protein